MKLLSVEQTREADAYTILHEPVSSLDLMERAATRAYSFIRGRFNENKKYVVIVGSGNNGGDGLVISRKLKEDGCDVVAVMVRMSHTLSRDCSENLKRLRKTGCKIVDIDKWLPEFTSSVRNNDTIIIDALFGSGLSRPLGMEYKPLIEAINGFGAYVISIDIPSGLFADKFTPAVEGSTERLMVRADMTLTLGTPKLCFFIQDCALYVGEVHLIDIGLSREFIEGADVRMQLIDEAMISSMKHDRKKFDNKGTYGHALIVAGSHGKMGAAIMASRACLRSGVGLLTVEVPDDGYEIIQCAVPEAMALDGDLATKDLSAYTAVGVGPGMGTDEMAVQRLTALLGNKTIKGTFVIDADAINILSKMPQGMRSVYMPKNGIYTPHPKEFQRLFGTYKNDFERLEMQVRISVEFSIYIVYKVANTIITTPVGEAYINTSGNPGMATGGSGDVLTGIITGLAASGYSLKDACIIGVFMHGKAGDAAARALSMDAMVATDIIKYFDKR